MSAAVSSVFVCQYDNGNCNKNITYFISSTGGKKREAVKESNKLSRPEERHVGLMVSASCSPSLSPGRGHCAVFLGKTLYSHSASFHKGV